MSLKKSIAGVMLAMLAPIASAATNATRIELLFSGLNLMAYGGPVASLQLSYTIKDDEPDQAPESPNISQFGSNAEITSNGNIYQTKAYIQIDSTAGHPTRGSSVVFTIPFPNQQYPGYVINTQISGIELSLMDSTGQSAPTQYLTDLAPSFGQASTSFRYFLRLGGWPAGTGTFYEYTNDSLNTASFMSTVTRITSPVPEPTSTIFLLLGLPLLVSKLRKNSKIEFLA